MAVSAQLSQIKAWLLTSGVQQTNNPLWQSINLLVDYLIKLENDTAAASGGGGTTIQGDTKQLLFQELISGDDWMVIPGPKGETGREGLLGPPGTDGEDGHDSFIPGQQGIQGIQGFQGIPGIDGIDGEDSYIPGPRGETGPSGASGTSGFAYLIETEIFESLGLLGIPSGLLSSEFALVEQTTTSTGTQDNFSLSGRNTYFRCNNASALVITGFTVQGSAPRQGDTVIIDAINSTVRILDEDAGSTAANRVITISDYGQIINTGGRMVAIYDGTSSRWRLELIDCGAFIDIAFDAADFTAAAGTWTVAAGDVGEHRYQQRARQLTIQLFLSTTTTSAATGALFIALPENFTIENVATNVQVWAYGRLFDSANWVVALAGTNPASAGTTNWQIFTALATTIPMATDLIYVQGTVVIEIL